MGNLFSSKFDPATDLQNLEGKVVIVTGGNTGVGYGTIKHLARRGAKVYMAARNESKATGAIARLEADGLGPGNGQVLWHKLDLSDPRDAKESAEEFLKRESRLDILINNAAILMGPFVMYPDGVQDIVIVNHVSPFVFTQHLLPLLKKTAEEPDSDVRIVNVASNGHYLVPKDTHFRALGDLNRNYANSLFPAFQRYCMTKLANVLWTKQLQKKLDADGLPIIAISVHPGFVNTFSDRLGKLRTVGEFILFLLMCKTWDQGAYNSVFAAASPIVRKSPELYKASFISGDYGKLKKPSKNAEDPEVATELWVLTELFLKSIQI